jgi:Tol biopolymer transport system component
MKRSTLYIRSIILLFAVTGSANVAAAESSGVEEGKIDLNAPHAINSAEAASKYMQFPENYDDKVLFSAVPEGAEYRMCDLFIMNSDGRGLKNLTNTPRLNEWGHFTSKGKIVYIECGYENTTVKMKYYVMDASGYNKEEIPEATYRSLVGK